MVAVLRSVYFINFEKKRIKEPREGLWMFDRSAVHAIFDRK